MAGIHGLYKPLNRERREFRLLKFLPSTSSDQPYLELSQHSMDTKLPYFALSYVWGTDSADDFVFIDDRQFPIRPNLQAALHQLRLSEFTGRLWIDALCINQSDVYERNWQVSYMRSIYSNADAVLIWLGIGSPQTDLALNFIKAMAPRALEAGFMPWKTELSSNEIIAQVVPYFDRRSEGVDHAELVTGVEKSIPTGVEFLYELARSDGLTLAGSPGSKGIAYNQKTEDEADEERAELPALGRGIKYLLSLPYWSRIWACQEIVLARRANVLCGSQSLSLEDFTIVIRCIFMLAGFGSWAAAATSPLRGYLPGVDTHLFGTIISLEARTRMTQGQEVTLRNLLVDLRRPPSSRVHFAATDPRDILFGVMGIVKEADQRRLGLRVDYGKTVGEVFDSLTAAMFTMGETSGRYFGLDCCAPRSEDNTAQLSTWALDMRVICEEGLKHWPISARKNGYNASRCIRKALERRGTGSAEFDPMVQNDHQTVDKLYIPLHSGAALRACGYRVDTISEVLAEPPWNEGTQAWEETDIEQSDQRTNAWIESVRKFTSLPAHSSDSGPGEDYVWRTVMLGWDEPWVSWYEPFNHSRLYLAEDELEASEAIRGLIRKIFRRESIDPSALTPAEAEFLLHKTTDRSSQQRRPLTLIERLNIVQHWPEFVTRLYCLKMTMFKTSKGMLGLSRLDVQPGNIVTVLAEVRSPIILCPRDGDRAGFHFKGEAFVDGIMHGEFLKTGPYCTCFEIY